MRNESLFLLSLIVIEAVCCTKVIIIGAGASGIAAARTLSQKGIKVSILEGRNRIGGRVNTDESFGYPIDLGAILITEQADNPLVSSASENGKRLVSMDFGNVEFKVKGLEENKTNGEALMNKALSLLELLHKYMIDNHHSLKNKSLEEITTLFCFKKKLSKVSRWLTKYGIKFITSNLSTKLKGVKDYIDRGAPGFNADVSMTPDGYINILKPFAENLNIKLNINVVEVKQNSKEVKVIDSKGKVYSADYVIVTVPLGVLKANSIKFTPSLSEAKQNAISQLRMFDMNKIFVEFTEKFWGDNDFLGLVYDEKLVYRFVVNFNKVNQENVLCFMISGDDYKYLEARTPEEVKGEIITLLKTLYPGKEINITKFKMTDWHRDQFTRGSFSELAGLKSDREEFSKPESRVYFAGEHSSLEWNSFVYGAYMSGIRAAKQIIDLKK